MINSNQKHIERPFFAGRWILRLFYLIFLLPSIAHSDTVTSSATYGLWDSFYRANRADPTAGEPQLLQITAITPNDANAWRSLTYVRVARQDPEGALDAVDRYLALMPDDDTMGLQRAYILSELDDPARARGAFLGLGESDDQQIAQTACIGARNLAAAQAKRLDAPYFAELYAAPGYNTAIGGLEYPLRLRMGREWPEQRLRTYGVARVDGDTASNASEIFTASEAILALGADWRPVAGQPVQIYGELGVAYDLFDRNRDRVRNHVEIGVAGYWSSLSTEYICARLPLNSTSGDENTGKQMTNFWWDVYANIGTYSRENYNEIAEVKARFGSKLLTTAQGHLLGYGYVAGKADTEGEDYNNYTEVGAGVSYLFPTATTLELRGEVYRRNSGQPEYDRWHGRVLLAAFQVF